MSHKAVNIPSIIASTPARVICCFTDWCNENTEVAVRSKNFIREPLTRLEMNDIVRQVDFINRADHSVYNLTWLGAVGGRGRSGLELEEEENNTGPSLSPGAATLLWALLCSLLYTLHF